jgi:hypothetical protein
MIKFIGSSGDRPVIGIGLSRENLERMMSGKPLTIDLATTRIESTMVETIDFNISSLILFAGETDLDLLQMLRDAEVPVDSISDLEHEENNDG